MDLNSTLSESRATEHFDFGSSSADLLVSVKKRNIRNEVTNKDPFEPEKVIAAFEYAKGITRRKPRQEQEEFVFRNVILDPEQQQDQDRLNELLNNKKYVITLWKDTWTTHGNYRVFVIYGSRKEAEQAQKPETEK